MRKAITAALSALTLALPVANGVAATASATAATAKKKVVVTQEGRRLRRPGRPLGDRAGDARRPQDDHDRRRQDEGDETDRRPHGHVYPDHTGRSLFINEQAIPYLRQEVLQAQ